MIQYVRNASFKYVKDIYQRLNKKDAHFVNPRGRFIDSPNVQIRYVAFDDETNRAIGFIDGYVFEEDPGTVILVMAVLPEYRKRYIAIELLNYAERAARSEGFWRLFARAESDNIPSIQMMKKFGFNYERKSDPSDTQIRMHKILQKGMKRMDRFKQMHEMAIAQEGFGNHLRKLREYFKSRKGKVKPVTPVSSPSATTGGKDLMTVFGAEQRKELVSFLLREAKKAYDQLTDKEAKTGLKLETIDVNDDFIEGACDYCIIVYYDMWAFGKTLGKSARELESTDFSRVFDNLFAIEDHVRRELSKKNLPVICTLSSDGGDWDDGWLDCEISLR